MRNRCRLLALRHTPKGAGFAKKHTKSLAGPILRLFDPVAVRRQPRRLEPPRRSEDRFDASRARIRAPGPLRTCSPPTLRRPEGLRVEGGENASRPCGLLHSQPTPRANPEGSTREPCRSPDSPRSSSTPANHRAACLRRDPTRRQSPAPSSVERNRSCVTLSFGSEEPADDARPEPPRSGASLERREAGTARPRRAVLLALATPWAA